jgi:hypothetical protein
MFRGCGDTFEKFMGACWEAVGKPFGALLKNLWGHVGILWGNPLGHL